jgi:hypothetical protein
MSVRRPVLVLVLLGAALALVPLPGTPKAAASCAGPRVDLSPGPPFVAGQAIALHGRYFVDGCNDTGGGSSVLGCTTTERPEPVPPMRDIEIAVVQGGDRTHLATVDASGPDDGLGVFRTTVRLPRTLHPGPAVLHVGTVSIRLRIGKPAPPPPLG